MARVVIDAGVVDHPGISKLVASLGWKRATAVGTVALLWLQTRAAGIAEGSCDDILPHLPCDPVHRRGLFHALVEAGFIVRTTGPFFAIEGNAAYLALIEKRRAAGKKGRAATTLVARARVAKRVAAHNPPKVSRKKKAPKPVPVTATAWQAYREAFIQTWGVEPLRNARVNACLNQFVQRIGADDAPAVLRFYLGHTDAMYVRSQHPMTLAVRDAEGLHVQWRRGQVVTGQDVRRIERHTNVRSQLARIQAGEL